MTKEVQKAIDFIHAYMHPTSDSEYEQRKRKYRDMAIEALEQDAIPVKWLEEKLTGHPELSYSVTDGIIAVLDLWKDTKGEK